MTIREMTIEDYDEVISLWRASEGIGLSEADSRENIRLYLDRNSGMSCVTLEGAEVVGAALCGHDGRRGYLHHLAVKDSFRGRGLGRLMVDFCLERLRHEGITKCHIFVHRANEDGQGFWRAIGWQRRDDLLVTSRIIS